MDGTTIKRKSYDDFETVLTGNLGSKI